MLGHLSQINFFPQFHCNRLNAGCLLALFPSSPSFYPLSRSWSFNLSCPLRLASRLELGSQVTRTTTDHLFSCCRIQHTEDGKSVKGSPLVVIRVLYKFAKIVNKRKGLKLQGSQISYTWWSLIGNLFHKSECFDNENNISSSQNDLDYRQPITSGGNLQLRRVLEAVRTSTSRLWASCGWAPSGGRRTWPSGTSPSSSPRTGSVLRSWRACWAWKGCGCCCRSRSRCSAGRYCDLNNQEHSASGSPS